MSHNNNPMISVVMSVYNGELYLDEAIQSILTQIYKDFEFIIINDGSTDKSLEIIKKYKDKRIVLISRENKGLIFSLNEGIKKAKGKYIARMDGDDISLPERFEKQLEFMEENDLDICGSHFFIINKEGEYIDSFIVPLNDINIFNYLCITTPFAHPSVIFRKQFMLKHNLLYGDTLYKHAEDYALWIQFWNKKAKFGNVNNFLLKYRSFNQSLSKVNMKNIKLDKKNISKNIILKNKIKLLDTFSNLKLELLPKVEQELIVMTLMILIKYKFSFKYFKYFKQLDNRAILFGIINFFRIGY